MSYSELLTVEFTTIRCCNCDLPFGMPTTFYNRRKEDGNWWYCPNGHQQHFSETDVMRLQKEKKRLEEQLALERSQLEKARKEIKTTKAKLTRTEKRVANGICPCCNRQFVQLTRHMKSKHPEYIEQNK